jgi:hypothetical protein
MHRLQGSRGYNNYFENWQPTLLENDDEADYSGMFTTSRLDPRIEQALPVLSKLNIRHHELSEANEFESWANEIVEGVNAVMDQKIEDFVSLINDNGKLPVGADAIDIKGQLEHLIDDSEHRDDLFNELEDAATADPDNDAKPAIISWLQKHRDEEFFGDVIERYEESTGEVPQEKETSVEKPKAPPKEMPPPQAQAQPPSQQDVAAVQDLMPPPMAESDDLVRIMKLSGLKK